MICGEEDLYVDGSQALHDGISGSQVHWIKNAGHDPSIEQPLATNKILLDFLGIPGLGDNILCIGQMTSHLHMIRCTPVP